MLDKKEAMARLDAIEAEAKKLREIIEAPDRWVPKKPTLCKVWGANGNEAVHLVSAYVQTSPFDKTKRYKVEGYEMYWDHAVPLTRAEALAMVDEPSRYPWDKAPEWADWAATDEDGSVYWFREKPFISEEWECWNSSGTSEEVTPGNISVTDWRESLEPRP